MQSSADPTAMIQTVDLRVDYDDLTAVQDLNLSIAAGEVFGLIGPNGAGKSSTIRVLATLQRPTYGDVYVGGLDVVEQTDQVHKIVGYMPDMAPVYDDLLVWEFLDLFAAAHFVRSGIRGDRVDQLIREVDLWAKRDAKCSTLSRGMRQRLCLAKTMLHEPKVMLLDEPASGIDPEGRIQMRELLKRLGKEGKTILVSSHILTELNEFCTSIGIMQQGRLVVSGRVNDIIARMKKQAKLIVEVVEVHERGVLIARTHPHVVNAVSTDHRLEIDFSGGHEDAADLLKLLISEQVRVKAFYEKKFDVEDIMLQVGGREV